MEDIWLVTCETCRRRLSISAPSEPEARRRLVRHHVHGAARVEEESPMEGVRKWPWRKAWEW
ncbi:MAG: hypothetical protein JRN46_02335 [Nitrososphaerota archaeon]|nr:hypothetical protein [Nitrososphaerota archaeon]